MTWIEQRGRPDLKGHRAIEGGRDGDGTAFYVARVFHDGGFTPGKVGGDTETLGSATVPNVRGVLVCN